jgi:hypothetical protein
MRGCEVDDHRRKMPQLAMDGVLVVALFPSDTAAVTGGRRQRTVVARKIFLGHSMVKLLETDVYVGHQNCGVHNGLLAFFRCGEGNYWRQPMVVSYQAPAKCYVKRHSTKNIGNQNVFLFR